MGTYQSSTSINGVMMLVGREFTRKRRIDFRCLGALRRVNPADVLMMFAGLPLHSRIMTLSDVITTAAVK